jgi:CMP-N-acetylneuraminic acid synthetase
MSYITALIPARGGSKGVLRKNIKDLYGYPLIAYTIQVCKLVEEIKDIYVSTEDEEIMNVAKYYGASIINRPKKYSLDSSSDNDVLKHFFSLFPEEEEVLYMRPTTPLRYSLDVYSIINEYFDCREKCSCLITVHEMSEPPHKMLKINKKGFCEGFFNDFNGIKNYTNLPRQIFPKSYHPNGYADIFKKKCVFEGNECGDLIKPYITEYVTEIDTIEEFLILENKLKVEGHALL